MTVENFSASTTNGSIFLAELIPGKAVSVVAGGAGSDVSVTGSAPTLAIGVITAPDTVTIQETGGALLSSGGMNVSGQTVNLTGQSGIGGSGTPFTVTAANLSATVKAPGAGIFVNDTAGLSTVSATTNAGDVAINYTGGSLNFTTSTALLVRVGRSDRVVYQYRRRRAARRRRRGQHYRLGINPRGADGEPHRRNRRLDRRRRHRGDRKPNQNERRDPQCDHNRRQYRHRAGRQSAHRERREPGLHQSGNTDGQRHPGDRHGGRHDRGKGFRAGHGDAQRRRSDSSRDRLSIQRSRQHALANRVERHRRQRRRAADRGQHVDRQRRRRGAVYS